MDDVRKERIARNEARFRSLNEQLVAGPHKLPHDEADYVGFLCECGDAECSTIVRLTLSKYEEVRSNARAFLLVPGHQEPAVEHVIEEADGYSIVEKHGETSQIAEETDPRG